MIAVEHMEETQPRISTSPSTSNPALAKLHKVEGSLEASLVGGRTAITKNYHRYPLKFMIVNPKPHSHTVARTGIDAQPDYTIERFTPAWAYVVNYGGGLVAGDDVGVTLRLTSGASVVLTGQSSTKIYKSKPSGTAFDLGVPPTVLTCKQSLEATVEKDALLAIVPHPVTCFAGSRYIPLLSSSSFHSHQNLAYISSSSPLWRVKFTAALAFQWIVLIPPPPQIQPNSKDSPSRGRKFGACGLAHLWSHGTWRDVGV